MLGTAINALLPVFFVLVLGYAAGRAKRFDADQTAGLNELVLDYALPASLFVGTVRTPREQLLQDASFVLALFVAFVALYVVALALGRREGIVICALPSAVMPTILSTRYRMYESEASSTLVFTSLLMVVTIPIVILLTGG